MSSIVPKIVASTSFGPQSGNQTSTAVYTPSANSTLRVSAVLLPASSVSTKSANVQIDWTDDSGVVHSTSFDPAFNAGDGQQLQKETIIRSKSGTAVNATVTVSGDSTNYSLYVVVEEL